MPAKGPPINIPVRLDKGQAVQDGRDLSKSLVSSLGPVAAAAAAVAVAYKAISAATRVAIDTAKRAVAAAKVQEEAEHKLAAAMKARGEFTQAALEANKKLADQIQRQTAIGDDEIIRLQAQLKLQGVSNAEMERAVKNTIGLAEVTGSNLQSAARQVTRAMNGEVSVLKRAGIEAANVTEANKKLAEAYSVAATHTETYAGKTELLGGLWGDLSETWGFAITQSPAVLAAVDALNNVVVELIGYFDSPAGREAINGFFTAILDNAASALEAFAGMVAAMRDLRGNKDPRIQREEFLATFPPIDRRVMAQGHAAVARVMRSRTKIANKMFPKTGAELAQDAADEARAAALRGAGGGTFKPSPLRRRRRPRPPGGSAPGPAMAAIGGTSGGFGSAFFGMGVNEAVAGVAGEMQNRVEATKLWQDEEKRLYQDHFAGLTSVVGAAGGALSGGLANLMGGMATAIGSGREAVLGSAAEIVGGLVSSMGQMLVQLGTASLVMGALSFIPGLNFVTGPPGAALAVGGIALGTGLVMMGVGAAMGGGGGPAPARPRVPSAPRAPSSAAPTGGGGFIGGQQSMGSRVVNVFFNNALPGSERMIWREVQRIERTATGAR
tara:strand:+ start:1042 stop:2874 length:1833 start_codon:yes stop_codon:yes gene_type:complete